MTRDEKTILISETQARFQRATVALLATNRGLTVAQATSLRKKLRLVGGEYKVVKHTLAKLAVSETPYRTLDPFLEGPPALVFGYQDPIAVTKALVEFAEQNQKIQVERGAVEGQIIEGEQVKALALLRGMDALRARIVRQVLSPGSRLVASVQAPAGRLAGALEALAKKLDKSGESAGGEPAGADAPQ